MSQAPPVTLIIFGASGDLTARKLLPALYHLEMAGHLPPELRILGAARREISPESLMMHAAEYLVDPDMQVVQRLQARIHVARMDSGQTSEYDIMRAVLKPIEGAAINARRLFYLSIPPTVSLPVIDAMAASGIATETPHNQLLLEKPFGYDTASAKELEQHLRQAFDEHQIYRIDHYLAKDTAQDLAKCCEVYAHVHASWSNQSLSRVEIEASEVIGVEGRADFYEPTGALRDLIQSHLMELMALTLMDDPGSNNAEQLHLKRLAVLQAVRPITPDEVDIVSTRGQYVGYREQVGNPQTTTETFAALRLCVDSERWQEVPIHLMTGKALDAKRTEIRLYPKAGQPTVLSLQASASSGALDGYERVLYDALRDDRRNFVSGDEVMAAWKIVEPVLQTWQLRGEDGLILYAKGSAGPKRV